jgi:hypothetical protein
VVGKFISLISTGDGVRFLLTKANKTRYNLLSIGFVFPEPDAQAKAAVPKGSPIKMTRVTLENCLTSGVHLNAPHAFGMTWDGRV